MNIEGEEIKLSIFDDFPIPILVLDNLKIIYYNDEFLKLINLNSNTLLLGANITSLLYKEDVQTFIKDLKRIYQSNSKIFHEKVYRFIIKNEAEPRWFSLSYKKLPSYFGKIQLRPESKEKIYFNENDKNIKSNPISEYNENNEYIIFTISDETERKQTQLALLQTHRLASIGELTYGIAHEINNPLFGILNYANLIKDSIEMGVPITTKSEEYEFVEGIIKEAKRISNIISNLSEFSIKSEENILKPTNIKTLISKVEKLLSYQIRHSHVNIIKEIEENLPNLLLQQYRMEQVLFNLILNSIHALNLSMKKDKKIIIRCYTEKETDPNYLIIKVYDNGIGISEDNLPKIFTPFFTTKRDLKGTGLGLHTVYNIVKDHGGIITVDSKVGEWTEFKIKIPMKIPKNDILLNTKDVMF
ncbi:MAG: PAS domain-containing sensor histidine kinase [Promethearchaeota archaeon]